MSRRLPPTLHAHHHAHFQHGDHPQFDPRRSKLLLPSHASEVAYHLPQSAATLSTSASARVFAFEDDDPYRQQDFSTANTRSSFCYDDDDDYFLSLSKDRKVIKPIPVSQL